MPIPHPEFESFRREFPILAHTTYLNSCSLGALSRRSMGYLGEYQALWNAMGASAWYELWLGRLEELRAGVADLWNARPGEISLSPSVSAALASIGSAVDFTKRPKVVVAELDFPTLIYPWLARAGLEVVRVPSDDGVGVAPERWAEYVDDRTALIATSHVFYATGYIQDPAPIAEAARRHGALFLFDGYQAAGQIPVDPRAAGADVYVGGPLKWLLGGPGLAFLWVREERLREMVPEVVSWFGAEGQFEFSAEHFIPRGDARRFELGTPAIPTAYTALGGLEIVREAGMEGIRARIAALTDDLLERLSASGFAVRSAKAPERRSGIVMVDLGTPERAAATVRSLAERRVVVDTRGRFVRISPHFYNTSDENRRLLDLMGSAP